MKKIKLSESIEKGNKIDEYELDPTEKYVINIDEEYEFQFAIYNSLHVIDFPPAIKNYYAWLYENKFNIEAPNPTNEVVEPYYVNKPLWKTDYSQGIVVKSENDSLKLLRFLTELHNP